MRDDETDEADDARDGDGSADGKPGTENGAGRDGTHGEAEGRRRVLAERERIEGAPGRGDEKPAHSHERQHEPDLRHAAVCQRAEHPENDFERGIGAGLGERIAQEALKARTGEAERRADEEPEQRARQADFRENEPGDVAVDRAYGFELVGEEFTAASDIDGGGEEERREGGEGEVYGPGIYMPLHLRPLPKPSSTV